MRGFLRRNWIWLLTPTFLFLLLFLAVTLLTEEEGAAPMTYALF